MDRPQQEPRVVFRLNIGLSKQSRVLYTTLNGSGESLGSISSSRALFPIGSLELSSHSCLSVMSGWRHHAVLEKDSKTGSKMQLPGTISMKSASKKAPHGIVRQSVIW